MEGGGENGVRERYTGGSGGCCWEGGGGGEAGRQTETDAVGKCKHMCVEDRNVFIVHNAKVLQMFCHIRP